MQMLGCRLSPFPITPIPGRSMFQLLSQNCNISAVYLELSESFHRLSRLLQNFPLLDKSFSRIVRLNFVCKFPKSYRHEFCVSLSRCG